jgi:EAL domain-containing protein (putative c-di-GMP-specific phosphodiesterase class I)
MPGATAGETANVSAPQDSLEWLPTAPLSEEARALEILEPPSQAESPAIETPTTDEVEALPTAGAPMLRLREMIRLRAGGRTRRYQVVPVAQNQRGDALATLNELLGWLQQNPKVLEGDPVSFTICVSAEHLSDPGLPAALARTLTAAALDPGTIGFELREAACLSHRPLADRFIAQCEQSRCFVVIDDFTFNTAVLDLLRSSAVRLVKVEARLVAMALRDKLAQARVVAIAQAAKVLGTLCAAKYVDAPASRRWLAAVGFDFTQSSVTEPLQRLAAPLSP